MKIQLQLLSYCKYSSSITIILRQNINIGICSGAAMEEAIGKDQSICVRKKKAIARHIDASSVVWTHRQWQISQSDCEMTSNFAKKYILTMSQLLRGDTNFIF